MYVDMYEYYGKARKWFKQRVNNIQYELSQLQALNEVVNQFFGSDAWWNINYAQQHVNQIQDWYCSKI